MESERFYRGVFYAGGGWNFLMSIPMTFLVSSLPAMIQIDAPRYPIFVYFNLMTVCLFGCIQILVARNLSSSRSLVKILVWSKMLTVVVFVAGLFFLAMPPNLTNFLLPGMIIDLIFGVLFWRYLFFSSKSPNTGTQV